MFSVTDFWLPPFIQDFGFGPGPSDLFDPEPEPEPEPETEFDRVVRGIIADVDAGRWIEEL